MTDFTVTILSDATAESTAIRVSVRIPEENAPMAFNPATGAEERDHGNADWPDDLAIAKEVARLAPTPGSVTRAWTLRFVDSGDDLLEAIYEATVADPDETAEHVGMCWGEEIAAEPWVLSEPIADEDQYVKDLEDMDFTVLRETLEANGYTFVEKDEDDEGETDGDDDSKVISCERWRRLIRICCQATCDYLVARIEEEAEAEGEAEDDAA